MCTALTGSLQIIRFHNNVSIIDDKMWDIDILLSCLVLHLFVTFSVTGDEGTAES